MEPMQSYTTPPDDSSEKPSPHSDFPLTPSTDVVLQSSDGVQFHVSKALLSVASTVFSDMFLSSGPRTTVSSSPEDNIVQMIEDSTALELFLRWIHPRLARPLRISREDQLQDAIKLLTLAEKYDTLALTMRIEDHLVTLVATTDAQSGEEAPLLAFRIYCIAYRFQLTECAKQAALRTLALPFHGFIAASCTEISLISIQDLATLAKYHNACCETARDILNPHIFCGSRCAPSELVCTYHTKRGDGRGYGYYQHHETRMTDAEMARWKAPFCFHGCSDCGGDEEIAFVPWMYLLLSECISLCAAHVDLRDMVELVFEDGRFGRSVIEAEGECDVCTSEYGSITAFPRQAKLQRVIREQVLAAISKTSIDLPWETLASPDSDSSA